MIRDSFGLVSNNGILNLAMCTFSAISKSQHAVKIKNEFSN